MIRKSISLAVFLVACFLLAPLAQLKGQDKAYRPDIQAKDIDDTCRTDWYGLYLKGKKIGYFKTKRNRDGDNVVDSFVMSMKLLSFGQKAEMNLSQSQKFEGKPPYRLLGGTFNMVSGPTTIKIVVSRNDKGYEHEVETGGQKRSRQVADLEYNLPDAMASEGWLRTGPKIGAQIFAKDLDMQEWKMEQTRHKIQAIKSSLVGGVEVKYFEVDSETRKDMISFLSRHDAEGKLLSGNFAIFELRQETEEQAKNTEYSQDLFVLGMAKIDKGIGRTTEITDLVVELPGKEGEVFESGPRQSVAAGPGGSKLLKIGKAHGKEVKATAKDIEENLAETNAYAISHAKVKALAKEAVGDAKTPEEKVKRIVAFTHNFVKPHLSASLPNIHDLMEKKSGDCKSYALLVTNLCRASGIPARDVSGLLYMGDDQKAFGGHAWNEVALGGVWVPVDASLGQTEVDAGHLCFGTDQRATRNLLNSLGKLSFRLVEVKTK